MMKCIKKILLFLFLASLNIVSQENRKDSIEDTMYVIFLEKITAAESEKAKINTLIKAGYYYFFEDISKSEYFYKKAAELLKGTENYSEANTLSKLGLLSKKRGDFDESYKYFVESKKIFETLKDTSRIGSSYLDIGYLYHYIDEKEKELEYYKKGYDLVKNINDTLVGKSYINFGSYYRREYKLDSSLYYYDKALEIFKKLKLEDRIHQVYNNAASSHARKGDYKKEIEIRKKTLVYAKKSHNKMLQTVNYHNIAGAYYKLEQYNTANSYIDSSLTVAINEGFKYRIARSYKTKAGINAKVQNYKTAYKSHQMFKRYSDTVFDFKNQNKIKELELNNKFEIEKKNLELIAHKKEAQNRLYIIVFSIVLFLGGLLVFSIRRNAKIRAKRIKDQLENEKLKKEILIQKFKTAEAEVKELIADNSMRLEFIKQLSSQIKNDKDETDSHDIKKYTQSLLLKLQQQITTENKFSLLHEKIEIINNEFNEKITSQFPSLTKTEREVCLLLRLNLSIKEIASIRNATAGSIKTIRYRIRKKMDVPKSQELEYFIQHLSF